MIREAQHGDIPALMRLVQTFFGNGELDGTGLSLDADTLEFFIQDNIDLEERAVFVSEVDGEIVGAIAGGLTAWWGNANIIMLAERGWFVTKEAREKYPREGIALLRVLRKWGKDNGAMVFALGSTVRDESARVCEFYRKMGLKHIDSVFFGPI